MLASWPCLSLASFKSWEGHTTLTRSKKETGARGGDGVGVEGGMNGVD